MSIESVMPSNHLILCCSLLLLPSIFPSIRVFSIESVLHIRWPNYWSFSFRISPSNEYSGLISFRIVWLDLLKVQGTLKSLLQHHSSKASILWCSTFLIVHSHIHTWLLEKPQFSLDRPLSQSNVSAFFFFLTSLLFNTLFNNIKETRTYGIAQETRPNTQSVSSVAQSCSTLCNPMNSSTQGLPVHHQLPEFTRTHVHWVGDAIQPSHPLSSPSPPAPNPSQH